MTEEKAYQCLVAVYAIFNKTAPGRSSPQVQMLAAKTQDIPDSLDTYIVDKMTERDTMPQNLINAFRGAWATWRRENPNLVARETCPVCHGRGGWTYYKAIEGRWRELFSFCPACCQRDGHVCKTAAQLREEGLLVLPDDYPGGACAFRRDKGLAVYPVELMERREEARCRR